MFDLATRSFLSTRKLASAARSREESFGARRATGNSNDVCLSKRTAAASMAARCSPFPITPPVAAGRVIVPRAARSGEGTPRRPNSSVVIASDRLDDLVGDRMADRDRAAERLAQVVR